ncbi:MAG: SDR family NAD(P)-dependent oxidoreductase [Patescibacteria group bacterium]|nr:SDR family NAD(P)-dependent oxidoreductase [Patescibacteria group bacterium]MCP6727502.1 SDR family NAD(P)-dependent oxidoreductase [Patescibacteria group bacterium]
MKTLVFGGQGFIGSHVIDNLLEKGHSVTIFDRRTDKWMWDECGWNDKDVTFRLGDIKDRDAVIDAVAHCDNVINLAGLLGTQEMIENPIPTVEVNILGALNVFDAIRMHKKRGFQIAVGNYWMNNPYSLTKNTTERFALMYNKEHGTDIRILRGMNVYGERQKHRPIRKIFPNLVIPALLGKDITIYGTGEQVMDLIYAPDISEMIVRVATNDNIPNDIIFEGGVGGAMTINMAVDAVLKATNSTSTVNRVPMRPGEDKTSVVEISEQGWKDLETHIGYSKEDLTPIDEAIAKSVEWYKEHLDDFPWDE